jgi:hypothetical protein
MAIWFLVFDSRTASNLSLLLGVGDKKSRRFL